MTLLRSYVFAAWLYLVMTVLGIVYGPLTIWRRENGFQAARVWTRFTLWGLRWIVGAKVAVKGLEHIGAGPYLVAVKHQSMLDTLVPFLFLKRPAVVLKRELLKAPLFGWYMKTLDMIAIDRDAQTAALKQLLKDARAARDSGRDVLIFPEGTRQPPGAAPDYKIGVAALYRDLGVPCLPIALDTGLVWAAHGPLRWPGRATFEVLEPIPPGLSRDAFMTTLQERIEGAVDALTVKDRAA